MIKAFIGQRNSGKTLTMTMEAYIKQKQGYKIYSNYHLNFPHIRYEIDDLINFAESGQYFGNAIFLIDELHIWFDSRCSGKKRNIIFSYFLNQSSKNDIDIYYTTQFARQAEIRIRLNTEIVIESVSRVLVWHKKGDMPKIHENYRPKPNDYKTICKIINIITQFSDTGVDKIIKRTFLANKYFSLYNTREVIKQQKDMFEKHAIEERKNIPEFKHKLVAKPDEKAHFKKGVVYEIKHSKKDYDAMYKPAGKNGKYTMKQLRMQQHNKQLVADEQLKIIKEEFGEDIL